MSIINTNGQPISADATEAQQQQQPQQPQRVQLTPGEAQKIIGAYARLKELSAATISNPRDDAEKTGLMNFLHSELLAHAEEFFGCWVAINQEYTPLITGFTALLQRALTRIDMVNQARAAKVTEKS